MGRIEHMQIGGQTGADMVRVNEAMAVQEHVYAELQPGDALFFHCNLLHKSDQNHSDIPRYAFLISYGATLMIITDFFIAFLLCLQIQQGRQLLQQAASPSHVHKVG